MLEAKEASPMWRASLSIAALLATCSACEQQSTETAGPVECIRDETEVSLAIEAVDLLFVVDNSQMMGPAQRALREQMPRFIQSLSTGRLHDNDPHPFPPVTDLHVGVVSTDMGVPGVELSRECRADGGDDGRLLRRPSAADCSMQPQTPPFLESATQSQEELADDLGCLLELGTTGCGHPQQLEAAFKALWPATLVDASGSVIDPNPYTFLAASAEGSHGRGDRPAADGGNSGFMRRVGSNALSLLVIVLMTDKDDCSVITTRHLLPSDQLEQSSPFAQEDIGLRCFLHKEFLYDLRDRYLNGLLALRPGVEGAVVFTAITGVPTDLVDRAALARVPWSDDSQRNAFYDAILSDARMQEEVDPDSMPGSGAGKLRPSCSRPAAQADQPAMALPPRRIAQLAKDFGRRGLVQSICEEDFGPAIDAITQVIADGLRSPCLPEAMTRGSDGKLACDVIWTLPPADAEAAGAPVDCSERAFLAPLEQDAGGASRDGGRRCKVTQLPVEDDSPATPGGEGWYYDDFSVERTAACSGATQQRIAFTLGAMPPPGVRIRLSCPTGLVSSATSSGTTGGPRIGSDCGSRPDDRSWLPGPGTKRPVGDDACTDSPQGASPDQPLFCVPGEHATCQRRCQSAADCPSGWVCNKQPHPKFKLPPFCTDPACMGPD